ncbi:MAG: SRPBCC domain-containing protein [Solirubrobacteraceae bacterium]|nr:SRPBCC domain-containing protein [Solirubrobacteraceae bacterium]
MTPDAVGLREIAVSRVYAAPRELVWRAWTEPERLVTWWGKRGHLAQPDSLVLEPWPGGRFHVTTRHEETGYEMTTRAVFRDVVALERLVFTEHDRGPNGEATESVVIFTDLGGGRTALDLHTSITTTEEIHRAAVAGLTSALERLGESLEAA